MRPSIYHLTASFVLSIVLVGCSSPDKLSISQAWARPSTAGDNGAVYFMDENLSSQEDSLINVRSRLADAAEVHLSGEIGIMAPVGKP